MDAEKYLKKYVALEEAAKAEIVEILSSNPTGRYIYFDCEIEEENDAYCDNTLATLDGNEDVIRICGVGLNDDNQIVITDYEDEENWFVPDEWTHAYLEMYQFVVNNLKFAKAGPSLSNKTDDPVLSNEEYVKYIAAQYSNQGLSEEELIEAGMKGLASALEKYEEDEYFQEFATWPIRHSIVQAINEKQK